MDEGAGLDDLVRKSLDDAGLRADAGVISWIAGNLGSDRMVSRMELEKLTLYAAEKSDITLEDAQAVIGDAAAVTLDDVVFAAAEEQFEGTDGCAVPGPVRRGRRCVNLARGKPSSVSA